MLSSEEFAEKIETLGVQGKSSIAFVIGGSIGTGKRSAEAFGLCTQFFKDDIPPSADAGDIAGTGVSGVSDHKWGTIP